MKIRSVFKSGWPFLPLLVFYVVVILVFSSDQLMGDETRHIGYATNLSQGFYAEEINPELRNGPGYPLVILPAVFVGASHLTIKLLNALFAFIAVILFFKVLVHYMKPSWAIVLSYLFGLYPPHLKWMTSILSESFAVFLVCSFLLSFIKLNTEKSKRNIHIVLSALFLGILVLTKVIFGYVILFALLFYFLLYLFLRTEKIKQGLLVLVGSFIVCIPYLTYTYSLTGKAFLWGTGGGEILYWHTTPFSEEYGDWISMDVVLGKEKYDYNDFDLEAISDNHRPFIENLEPYSHVQRDSLFKNKAVENIKKYPTKYIENTAASAFRLFFNYPHSYTPQKITTYFYIVPNMFLLFFLLLSVYLSIKRFKDIPFEIRFVGLITLITVGGLILLNGKVRHLMPCIPLIYFFIIFVHQKLIQVRIKDN